MDFNLIMKDNDWILSIEVEGLMLVGIYLA